MGLARREIFELDQIDHESHLRSQNAGQTEVQPATESAVSIARVLPAASTAIAAFPGHSHGN